MSRRLSVLLPLVLACAPWLVGCGEEAPPPPVRTPGPVVAAPLPAVAEVPLPERAAYALDRVLRGPVPADGLVVPDVHQRNLEIAIADLVDLAPQALALLADPALVARVTGQALRPVRPPAEPNGDPWQNILRLLLAIQGESVQLDLAWARPALAIPPISPLAPLRLDAAKLLASTQDPAVAPALLDLLTVDADDREVAAAAFPALQASGSPWAERALDVALGGGSPSLWSTAQAHVLGAAPAGGTDVGVADRLTWWAALVEGSGPRLPTLLPRLKTWPWVAGRLWTDPAVATGTTGGLPPAGPLPASVALGAGWLAPTAPEQGVFPLYGYGLTGKVPAAEARCGLARWGYPPYVQAVEEDLAKQTRDPGDDRPRDGALYYTALHCMLDRALEQETDVVRARLQALLDEPAPPSVERSMEIGRLLGALPSCEEPADWTLLARCLRELRPLDAYRTVIEQAYDAMQPRSLDLARLVQGMFDRQAEDPGGYGVALHLVRRSVDAVYIPILEALLADARDPGQVAVLRSTLVFLYARATGIEPRRHEAFVARLVDWVQAEGEARASTGFLPALLDFGASGARAFADGLGGPRREEYLRAWPRSSVVVPRIVAEAALAPLDARTPQAEAARVLGAGYHTFPASAAPALAALLARCAPGVRPWVAAVLERVRHRAPHVLSD